MIHARRPDFEGPERSGPEPEVESPPRDLRRADELLAAADEAVSVHDARGQCLGATPALADLLGRSRARLVGQRVQDFLVDIDPGVGDRLLRRLAARGGSHERLHTFIPGRGFRWLELVATRAFHAAPDLFLYVWTNITDELCGAGHDAPRRMQRMMRALAPDPDKPDDVLNLAPRALREFFRAGSAVLAELDDSLRRVRIVQRSPEATEVDSYDLESSIFGRLVDAPDARLLDDLAGVAPGCRFVAENRFTSVLGRLLLGRFGRPRGIVCVFDPDPATLGPDDVTALALAADCIQNRLERHELDRIALQSHLAADLAGLTRGVAHDLNNHLTCILGNAYQIRSLIPEDLSVQRCVEGIEEATDAAADVAGWVRNFSRDVHSHDETSDVDGIVADTVRLIQRLAKTITVEVDDHGALPPAMAGPREVRQIVLNVLRAAVDAVADSDGGAMRVATQLDDDREGGVPTIGITVADTGSGAPAASLRPGDTGAMALVIAERLATAAGGTFSVVNEPGVGTTVRVGLPASAAILDD